MVQNRAILTMTEQ